MAWLGMSIPVHIRAVSPILLAKAGARTDGVQALASRYVTEGRTGPVRMLWESGLARPSEIERLAIVDLLAQKPQYLHSGGPAPYYEAFLASLAAQPEQQKGSHVADLLLQQTGRAAALKQLYAGTNGTAQALLNTRRLESWRRFMPVNSYAGQPLDASILTLAMLAQSGSLSPELEQSVTELAKDAVAGNRDAMDTLEETLMATLTLGRRMDWTQLSFFIHCVKTPADLADAASRIATSPKDMPTIFAATVMRGDYAPVGGYISRHAHGEGIAALREAIADGQGAMDLILRSGAAMYRPPRLVSGLERHLAWTRPGQVTLFALHHPRIAFVVKNVTFFASGLALALAARCLWICLMPFPGLSPCKNKIYCAFGNLFVAGAFTVIIWLSVEPNLLRFTTEQPALAVFDIRAAFANNPPQSQAMNANSPDQASILSLLFFFFVQMAVYVFCIARLRRIKAMNEPAPTKLKLLENDENLLDLGLYIGLGGTVAAFLMLELNIVQSSHVAAYSSTLFGLLFWVILKVAHVRTFRRRLILEAAESEQHAKANVRD